MSKKRLEEIKEKVVVEKVYVKQLNTRNNGYWTKSYTVLKDDWNWLIEQAERVQDLEEIIYKDERQAVLEGLYEENRRYREALKEIEEHGIQEMFTELKELEDEE